MSAVAPSFRLRRKFQILSAMLSLCCALGAQTQEVAARPAPMIKSPVDELVRLTLKDGTRPETTREVDLGTVGADVRLEKMVLLLKRSPAAQAAFDQLASEQQNPRSPRFHHWLTPEQIGQQFGAAPADTAQIVNWLQGHGFQVDSVAHGGLMILFSGTEGQLESAFRTSMHSFRNAAGEIHAANVLEPSIPAALAPVVAGIASLNNYPIKPMSHLYGSAHLQRGGPADAQGRENKWQVTRDMPAAPTLPASTSAKVEAVEPEFFTKVGTEGFELVSPYDFATIYNVAPLWNAGIDGTGETIAVLAESDINPQDVASFRSTFGLPANPVNIIYVGPNPGKGPSEGEADLDAEWSGAVAKNATIDVVVAHDTLTSNGLVLGAYDVIDNNLASVLSVSWGECEYGLGNAGNQLFSAMWEQAAAQGITVTVASGDAGSAACDQGSSIAARFGLTVNGMASTPYNIAVGGTDLYGTYSNFSTSWSRTNDPTTLASALGYINEIPWNNSCGSPEFLAAAVKAGQVSDTNNEQFCNDFSYFPSGAAVSGAGGGGLSACIESDGQTPQSCSGGYASPVWQAPLTGAPFRVLPDVSLFAGNGLWATAYVFCQSDATPDGTCNDTSSKDLEYLVAGGTSFGTPAFAGIMALIDQKVGARQGNAAPILYQLYNTQVANGTSCDTSVATANSGCAFQDISEGSNAQPCLSGSFNCFPQNPNDSYGVLSGYTAYAGFDAATGLGSVNAANLANGWVSAASVFAATQTTLTLAQSSLTYGAADAATVTVAGTSGTPTGDVAAVSTGFGSGPFPLNSTGSINFSLLGLSVGTHSVTAHYAGDGTFAPSDSTPVSVTVTQAATSLTAQSSLAALAVGDSVTLSSTVATTSKAASPTGTVAFTDSTSGAVLATAALSAATDGKGNAIATAQTTVQAHQLQNGANSIVASYTGDTNYLASAAPPLTISYTAPFALSLASSTLTIPAQGSASATVTVTSSSSVLPQPVFLSCPQMLPTGLSCAFSPAVLTAGSKSATSTLTLYASSALAQTVVPARPGSRRNSTESLAAASLAGMLLLLTGSRRARRSVLRNARLLAIPFLLGGVFVGLALSGCSGGASPTNPAVAPAVQLAVSSSLVSTGTSVSFTATVTDPKGASVGQVPISFIENGATLGTATLNAQGVATFSTSSLPVGPHSVFATYPGTGTELAANSPPVATDISFTSAVLLSASDSAGDSSNATLSVTVK